MRQLKWIAGLGLVLLVVLVSLVVWLRELDLSEQSQRLTQGLSALIGRDLEIHGAFRVGLSLWPRVIAEEVTLANASWASRPAMLEARRVEFVLAIWPLFSGRIEVSRIEVEDVSVWVEPSVDGVVNWDIGAGGASSSSGVPEFDLRQIRATRARIIWRVAPGSEWHDWRLAELEARTEGERSPLSLKVRSTLDRDAVLLEGRIGSLPQITLGEAFDVHLEGHWGGVRAGITGRIEDVSELSGIELDVSLNARKLSDIPHLDEFPDLGPLELRGHVKGLPRALEITKAAGVLGRSDVGGSLRVQFSTRADEPAFLSGQLASSVIDVAQIIDAFDRGAGDDREAARGKGAASVFSGAPLDLEALTRVGLQLALDADDLRMRDASFEVTHAELVVKQRRLRLAPVSATFRGARIRGDLEIDGRGTEPQVKARLLGQNFDLGAWLERLGVTDRIAAKVDVAIDVRGQGDSQAAILASLDGRVAAAIVDGEIPTQYVDLAVADLGKLVIPWARPKVTDIECAVMQFDVAKGVADSKLMMFDTEKMAATGRGEVDLRNETLDFVLAPRPRDKRLLSLATDVVIKGPITHPSARPRAIGLASTLVRFAFGPTQLLDPFDLFGNKKQHPCVDAVQEVIDSAEGSRRAAEAR